MSQNQGKQFEKDFQDSVPSHVFCKRFKDNAASFSGGAGTRFTSTNECDFMLYDRGRLYFLELKSTLSSLTYWRKDFKSKNVNIKKNQIEGLLEARGYGIVSGFLFNFRNTEENETFFVDIREFVAYTSLPFLKKSINRGDVLEMNPIRIESRKLRVNHGYDIEGFLLDTVEKFDVL